MEFPDSDITIILNDKEYKVHKIMLRKLPYFNTMFDNFKEMNDKVIVLDNVDVRYWEKFLNTMYNYKEIKLYEGKMNSSNKYMFDEEYIQFCNYMGLKDEIDKLNSKILVRCSVCDFIEHGDIQCLEYIMKNRELRLHLFDYYNTENGSLSFNNDRLRQIITIFQLYKRYDSDKALLIHKYKDYPLFMYYGTCLMQHYNFKYDIKKIEKEIDKDVLIEGYNKYFKQEVEDLCKLYKEDKKNVYDLDVLILHYMSDPTEEIAYYIANNFDSNVMKNDRLVKKVIEMYPNILGDNLDKFKDLYKFEIHKKTIKDDVFKDMKLILGYNYRHWHKNNQCISTMKYDDDKINRDDIYYSLNCYILSNTENNKKTLYDTQLPKNTKLFMKRCYISDENPINKSLFHQCEIKEYIYGEIIKRLDLYSVHIKVETDLNDIYIEY